MKKLILISALLLFASNGWAEEEKVCSVYFEKNMNVEKMRKTLADNNCQKGDILYIRADANMMGIAAHVCDIEKTISERSGIICEYTGEVREGNRTKDYDLRLFRKDG